MHAGDYALEVVGHVEHRGVHVGDFDVSAEQFGGHAVCICRGMTFCEHLHRTARPHRPMPEQAAHDAPLHFLALNLKAVRRDQVRDNVVIIARVQRDILAP